MSLVKAFPFGIFVLLALCKCGTAPERDFNGEIESLNASYAALALKYGVDTLDTYHLFTDSAGAMIDSFFLGDHLHLDTSGYTRWIDQSLRPYMERESVTTVAMLGNSIVAFLDNGPPGYGFGPSTSWEAKLGRKAFNFGVSEDKSWDLLSRLHTTIFPEFEWYFVLIGTNDVGREVRQATTLANVEAVIQRLQEAGKKVVLQMVMPRR